MPYQFPRILKLAPRRDDRFRQLVAQGHCELNQAICPKPTYGQLVAWGWVERTGPVDFLDAYEGYRPTAAGRTYLLYDEAHHLLAVRKEHVEYVRARILEAMSIGMEGNMVAYTYRIALARERGWRPDPEAQLPVLEAAQLAWYTRRGYQELDEFLFKRYLSFDELIVSGVLRYCDEVAPFAIDTYVVAPKGRSYLLYSKRWRAMFVRPGMAEALYKLVAVEVLER